MTAFSDEMAARRLEARALIDEAQRLIQNDGVVLLRLAWISGVPYETLRRMRKGEACKPKAERLQKLRDAVAKLRESAAA